MSETANTNVSFTPYEISFCLHDTRRTRMWKEAIESTVKEGDVVIDAGSGTGILGAFAAMAGAKHVYCIELHPRFVRLIKNLAERNGLTDKMTVIHGDASKITIPEKADVLICELLCTGQFFEPQVQVVNHLRKFLRPGARTIPQKVRSMAQLLDAQENLYGVRIDCDSRAILMHDDEAITDRVVYDTIDFSDQSTLQVNTEIELTARRSQLADAILIEGEAELTPEIITQTTEFLYNPEVIFLKEPMELEKGQKYRVEIRYPYGGDTLDAHFKVKKGN